MFEKDLWRQHWLANREKCQSELLLTLITIENLRTINNLVELFLKNNEKKMF